ncbi:Protein kinase domain-containing protein ppk32 [Coemansia guatemalensis]|uniref:Protein kinase domain-containing protein ppk32 n=1 Tax=Coemansia guatemalensis TaxID=2761395 RepID=A0A9W8LU88_9FUNG|nr:Protein kinase domain-containing protein ppk32 [Coemansia guatemalensis]
MDIYFNKLRGLASAAVSAVQGRIARDYDFSLNEHPQGNSGHWALHKAKRRGAQPQQGVSEATVWVFDKQRLNRQLLGNGQRENLLAQLSNEASQLTRLRHPSVLRVVEPLEDTRGYLMFVTEPVECTLEDMLDDNSQELEQLEVQMGLLQIVRALRFLHGDAQLVHGALEPQCILIAASGDWKLGGLGRSSSENSFDYLLPAHAQHAMDYSAPELVLDGKRGAAGDVFSVGCIAMAALAGTSMACRGDSAQYQRQLVRLTDSVDKLPAAAQSGVRGMLARNAVQRISLEQIEGCGLFSGDLMETLQRLEALVELPRDQQAAFVGRLVQVLPRFSVRVQRRRLLPLLLGLAADPLLQPPALRCVLLISENLEPSQFSARVLPALAPLLGQQLPAQTTKVVLASMTLLQRKAGSAFSNRILPILTTSLSSTDSTVVDHALQVLPEVTRNLTPSDLRDKVLPPLQQVYSRARVLALKLRALEALRSMVELLDRTTIVDKILPLLQRTKSRDPAITMAMLAVYEQIGVGHLDRQQIATEVMPVLWAHAVDRRLQLPQFDRFMQVIHKLSKRIEDEQRRVLEEGYRPDQQSTNEEVGGIAAGSPLSVDAGWAWDAPAADTLPQQKQHSGTGNTRVEADYASSTVDVFGSQGEEFADFTIPPPKKSVVSPPPPSIAQQPMRLQAASHSQSKLGAVKLSESDGPLRFGATNGSRANSNTAGGLGTMSAPLTPTVSAKTASRSSQKHAGGKAADLGDFDPFA